MTTYFTGAAFDRTDIHVRLPETLAASLRQVAKENERTLNAEIVRRLKASFEGYTNLP